MTKYLIIALLTGALAAFAGYVGYNHGKKIERAAWLKVTQDQATKHTEEVNDLHDQYRKDIALFNVQSTNISNNLHEVQNEIKNISSVSNKRYDAIERLLFNISAEQASSSEKSTPAIAAIECNGETRTVLSGMVSRAIHEKFGSCNRDVQQLTACQELLIEQRNYCNN